MQMVKKIALIVFSSLIALLIFAPKENLYFLLEKELQKNKIVLSQEELKPKPLGLEISNAKVYIENTYIGNIKTISILTLLVYSDIDILEFKPIKSIEKIFPLIVHRATINYTLWNPTQIKINVKSSMGKIDGRVDLIKKRVIFRFKEIKNITPIRSYLKRDKNGWYYEQNF